METISGNLGLDIMSCIVDIIVTFLEPTLDNLQRIERPPERLVEMVVRNEYNRA